MRAFIDFDTAPVFAVPTPAGPREGMLLDGPQGWGEFSPPPDAEDALSARWLTAAMEPSTVGWPDASRGRVPVADAATRPAIVVDDIDAAAAEVACLDPATQFVELICRNIEDARAVRRLVDVPVAVDAGLLVGDPVGDRQAADIAVLRCGPLGGVRRALRRWERLDMPAVVNFSGTTSIGAAADVALAAALPELPYACGPAPQWLSAADIVSSARSLVPIDGTLPAAPMPAGPDPARLADFAVTDRATVARWRDRVHRVAALI